MIGRLLTPRWLGALLLAVLWGFAAYQLGGWQYGRHVEKVERNARLDAHYAAAPVPLGSVLGPAPLETAQDWTRVTATGSYAGSVLLVRNRTNFTEVGYEVLALFVTGSGERVAVDRGFVRAGRSAADTPVVAPPPSGVVTLTGWVRPGEESWNRGMPPGQLASINLAEAAAGFGGGPVLGGYVLLEEEHGADGKVSDRPAALEPPARNLGPHQAYAYQWWIVIPLGLVLMYFGIRREVRLENPEAEAARRAAKAAASRWNEEDS